MSSRNTKQVRVYKDIDFELKKLLPDIPNNADRVRKLWDTSTLRITKALYGSKK